MRKSHQLALAFTLLCVNAYAADDGISFNTPPQPSVNIQQNLDRITPEGRNADTDMLTTRDPVQAQPQMPAGVAPFQRVQAMDESANPASPAAAPAPATSPFGQITPPPLPKKIPFGRAESSGPAIPSGPHTTVSVPVVSVDAVEAAEAAPPTPVAPEADPVQEDPAEPTELTSPIFQEEEGIKGPRKIILRALNKVTAQSETLTLKPNETAKFGQLEITAVTCSTSLPTSQTDHAALLDISEKLPKTETPKPLFRGWMYASSPSITALEHPVYDVTMVECSTMPTAKEKDEKEEPKKETKPEKKPKR